MKYQNVNKEGYDITFYPAAYKKKHHVITILAPEGKRTVDFYLSGYVWRDLQTKKRVAPRVEKHLKDLFEEFKGGQDQF